MQKTKGVSFDLYGTLLIYGNMRKAWSDWLEAFHSALTPLGLPLSLDAFSKECDRFFEKEPPPRRSGSFSPFESRIDHLCVRIGLDLNATTVAHIADHVAQAWEEHVRVDADAAGVLAALAKERSLALISNFDHPRHFRKVISNHRLAPFFESIIVSGEVGMRKPDPGIFGLALAETRLSWSDVVYVGDTDEDVEGARAAGIRPILIRRLHNGTDPTTLDFTNDADAVPSGRHGLLEPDVTVVRDLKELLTVLL